MTDAELIENLKRIAGSYLFYCIRISRQINFVCIDPKTREIYDYQDFVHMLLPILRADGQVCLEFNLKNNLFYLTFNLGL